MVMLLPWLFCAAKPVPLTSTLTLTLPSVGTTVICRWGKLISIMPCRPPLSTTFNLPAPPVVVAGVTGRSIKADQFPALLTLIGAPPLMRLGWITSPPMVMVLPSPVSLMVARPPLVKPDQERLSR